MTWQQAQRLQLTEGTDDSHQPPNQSLTVHVHIKAHGFYNKENRGATEVFYVSI